MTKFLRTWHRQLNVSSRRMLPYFPILGIIESKLSWLLRNFCCRSRARPTPTSVAHGSCIRVLLARAAACGNNFPDFPAVARAFCREAINFFSSHSLLTVTCRFLSPVSLFLSISFGYGKVARSLSAVPILFAIMFFNISLSLKPFRVTKQIFSFILFKRSLYIKNRTCQVTSNRIIFSKCCAYEMHDKIFLGFTIKPHYFIIQTYVIIRWKKCNIFTPSMYYNIIWHAVCYTSYLEENKWLCEIKQRTSKLFFHFSTALTFISFIVLRVYGKHVISPVGEPWKKRKIEHTTVPTRSTTIETPLLG